VVYLKNVLEKKLYVHPFKNTNYIKDLSLDLRILQRLTVFNFCRGLPIDTCQRKKDKSTNLG